MAVPPALHGSALGSSADRLRTLLLITSTAGGAGLHALYLARHLPRQRFDLTVAFGPGYPLDAQFASLDLPVVHLAMSRRLAPLANARAALQLWRLLRRENFDLVVSACSIAGLLGRVLGWLAGVPRRVYILHAYASHAHQPPLARWTYRAIERLLDRFTTHYYAVSAASRQFGVDQRLFAAQKATVIYNGIPFPEPPADAPEAIRAEFGVPPTAPLIVTAGRLETQKGLIYLLDALALMRRSLPDVRCLIVGDGPLRAALASHARALGLADATQFTGWRNDVPRLLHAADVFCLPSLWETFGLVLVEAMALGKPVVASRVDGIPEVIADGQTGLLVPPADPPRLAEALLDVLRNPDLARRLGVAGRARAMEHFALEPSIARYAAALAAHVGTARNPRRRTPVPLRTPRPEARGLVTPEEVPPCVPR